MRISTAFMYHTGLETINAQQSQLLHTFQQIGTGRRMVTPSDDPLAASRAINLGQSEAQNTRFSANREIARQALNTEDGVLDTVGRVLQDIRTRLIEAGDGGYSDKDRQALASVLHHAYELLGNQANSRDGSGQFLFSGSSGDKPPYKADATGKLVLDDTLVDGDRKIQVDMSRQLSSGDMAKNVFRLPGTTTDVFDVLHDTIAELGKPVEGNADATKDLQKRLLSSIDTLDAIYDNVLTVRASVGARGIEIDGLDNNGALRNLNYRKELSTLEDTNYYEASSLLTLRQAALEAAAMAFRRIQNTSLFSQ